MNLPVLLWAEPAPGDVFREYRWTNQGGDADGSLRVGGRLGYGGTNIQMPYGFDLEYATRAEVVVEKLLCHAGTKHLELSVNDHPWLLVPEAAGIPEPQWDYQHHTYPVVSVPVSQLRQGKGNSFRLRVSPEHPWNWPQNLIYGVHFRIYYDPTLKDHPTGHVVKPASGDGLGQRADLEAETDSAGRKVVRVDFLGEYEDVNLEGDGSYRRWHYHYEKSRLTGHLGSATQAPWQATWDTSWVPDQPPSIRLLAWITDSSGLTYCTPAVDGLWLERDNFSVELCKPMNVPRQWVTRSGEHSEKLVIKGDLSQAIAAKLVWCSWSPGYMEGVYINGQRILRREGPRYAYYLHDVPLGDLSALTAGENLLKTGKTPKQDGKTVHGMEVNWPGIMLLIRYQRRDLRNPPP